MLQAFLSTRNFPHFDISKIELRANAATLATPAKVDANEKPLDKEISYLN